MYNSKSKTSKMKLATKKVSVMTTQTADALKHETSKMMQNRTLFAASILSLLVLTAFIVYSFFF